MRRCLLLLTILSLLVMAPPAGATAPPSDGGPLTVSGGVFRDSAGREVVLRGFNVSGEAKLAENHGLPFATTADAQVSAAAMRRLGGANAVRFLVTWAWVEPSPGQIDRDYLGRVAEQITAFTGQGIRVYLDFHQDLYSRYLFNPGSWYTGDGAPAWVVRAGGYPAESCGLCFHWGQNMKNNKAVTGAVYDFWHNRQVTTAAGPIRIRDEFLFQAGETMRYLKDTLPQEAFDLIVGADPLNEPYAGRYDSGQDGVSWERDLLWPFYQQFRARMDSSGWAAKPALVEPLVFWNQNVDFFAEPGGLTGVSTLGDRYVFNTHFYDGKAQSGILKPGKANDGEYSADFGKIRDRATALSTAAIVSEFGHPVEGYTSDKAPSVLKAMYQSLDSRLNGASWWAQAAMSGHVLSGSQWHWDIYYNRHHELMNDNPDKVKTDGDAMNDEHFSAVRMDGPNAVATVDARLFDRVFPQAVAGNTLAFTYEDRVVQAWNQIPASMPAVRRLAGTGQYAVLVWRSGGSAPTELHLPASFTPSRTTVVSDLGSVVGIPAYTGSEPVAYASDSGGSRLLLSTSGSGVHFALVAADGTEAPSAALAELRSWASTLWPSSTLG
ncbi:cellulase family glycosylhydrolase [Actinocrispum sp. NPDC049592]|uniref:cellulase family glycosylhydrolase n=1 Tax=Actinocrispum sp. NPDC049592 TaxID=3154835 RepID=UPI003447A04C